MTVNSAETLEPVIDPANRISFLLDWELTMKCNLDCDYCAIGIYGGHDNSTRHPLLSECIKTIEFMYKYVDLYMSNKINGLKYVILNVYGGESLHHPDIVKILKISKEKYLDYKSKWHLTVTTTTNGIISNKKFDSIIPFIDEFTFSYHSQNTLKQKEQFKRNILSAKNYGARVKCVVLKHPKYFKDTINFIEWCEKNNVKYLPRQLDNIEDKKELNYSEKQIMWFDNLYKLKNSTEIKNLKKFSDDNKINLTGVGRACCGGRSFFINKNYKNKTNYVQNNNFEGWSCSVNHFFVYIKQVNGEIYTNKDCKVNFNNEVGPIGNLNNTEELLNFTKKFLESDSMPFIQCVKKLCLCGICSPKAKNLPLLKDIMKKYTKKDT